MLKTAFEVGLTVLMVQGGRGGAELKLGLLCSVIPYVFIERSLHVRPSRDGRLLPSQSLHSVGREAMRQKLLMSAKKRKPGKGVESDGNVVLDDFQGRVV